MAAKRVTKVKGWVRVDGFKLPPAQVKVRTRLCGDDIPVLVADARVWKLVRRQPKGAGRGKA